MDTEQSMKKNSEFSRELICQMVETVIFCKVLSVFSNLAQFAKFCENLFCDSRIAES